MSRLALPAYRFVRSLRCPAASCSLIHIIHRYTRASCPIHRPDGAGASASSPADRPPGRRFVKSGRDQLRRLRRRAHRRRRGRALGRRRSARRPAAAAARLRRGSRPPRRSSPQSTMRSRGPMRLICGMSCRATSRTRVVEARRCAAVRDRAAAADACAPAEAAHAPVQAERGPAVLGRAGSLTPPLLTDSIYPRPLQEAPAEDLKFKGTRYPDFGRLEVGRGSWHFRETWRLPCPQPSRIVFPTLTLCALLDCDPSRYGFLIPDDRDSPRSADASRR